MPNIKSAEKRVKVSSVKTLQNRMVKSSLRTAVKKFRLACEQGDAQKAREIGVQATKVIDKAAAKGVIHKNFAARKKSEIARACNRLAG